MGALEQQLEAIRSAVHNVEEAATALQEELQTSLQEAASREQAHAAELDEVKQDLQHAKRKVGAVEAQVAEPRTARGCAVSRPVVDGIDRQRRIGTRAGSMRADGPPNDARARRRVSADSFRMPGRVLALGQTPCATSQGLARPHARTPRALRWQQRASLPPGIATCVASSPCTPRSEPPTPAVLPPRPLCG